MADASCPLCRSTEIIAIGFADGMRSLRIRCSDCGRESHLPYPKPPDRPGEPRGVSDAKKLDSI